MVATPIIEFKEVGLSLGGREIHRSISFRVDEGETLTVLGPSGTGKTLLFKLLIGLLSPTRGEIYLRGERIDNLHEAQYLAVRKNIGMLFQGAALFDSLSVFENVAYPLRETGEYNEGQVQDIVGQCLSFVDLEDYGSRYPLQLSGGQRKRIGLARALASSPAVVLFDEPTTGLDPTSARLIDDLIVRLASERRITSLVITHDIASARRVSHRWMLLSDGVVQAIGPVSQIERDNALVRDFVNGRWKQ